MPSSWDWGTALLSAGWTRAFPLDIEWDESSLVLVLRNLQVHLSLSLSVDHRVIDGADAGRFINYLKQLLENPSLLLID